LINTAARAAVEPLGKREMLTVVYWDPSGAATANGGTGTWNTTTAEWRSGSPTGSLVAWSNSANYDAVFPASSGTVTLGTGVTAKSLTFNASGYTITGNTLTFNGGTGQIDVPSGDTTTISSVIAGSNGLTKIDSGTLTLSGTNTYTGGTNLSAGQLNLNSNGAISSGTFTIAGGEIDDTSGYTVTLSGNNSQIWAGNFTYGGSYSLNLGTGGVTLTGNRTITAVNKNLTVGGVISDGGNGYGITKASYGMLWLTAANTFSGQTAATNGSIIDSNTNALQDSTVNLNSSGSLLFSSGLGSATLGSLSGNHSFSLTDMSSGAITLGIGNDSATSTYSGVLNGSGGVKVLGGTNTLTGANTYTGGTTITGGTLILSGSGTAGSTTSALNLSGGTLDLSGTNQSFGSLTGTGGTILNNDSGTASTLTIGGGTTTFAGLLADNSTGTGTLALTTSGTTSLTLTGSNTYSGTTTVGSGSTLALGNSGTTGSLGSGSVTDNGTMIFNRSNTLVVANVISGSGSVTQAGSGLTVVSSSNTYTGSTNISAGTFAANSSTGSATGTGSVAISPAAILVGSGSVSGTITVSSGGTLNVVAGASLGDVDVHGSVTVDGSASISSLTIEAGGEVQQVSTDTTFGDSVITIGSLRIAAASGSTNGGVLDLGNGDLIVTSTAASTIVSLLAAGYDGGLWDGAASSGPYPAAIISSTAANDPYQIDTLGYLQIGTGTGEWNLSTFDGQSVSSGDTVVGLTYYGDANLDRVVNASDYTLLDNGYNMGLTGWSNGDFNYDGIVDGSDYDLIDGTSAVLTTLADGGNPNTGRFTVTVSSNTPVAPGDSNAGSLDVTLYDNTLKKNVAGAKVTYTVHGSAGLYFKTPGSGTHVTTIDKTSPNTSVSVYASSPVPNDGSWSVDIKVTWPDGTTQTTSATISPPN
jgi:autotransporter-associated beta strand protein